MGVLLESFGYGAIFRVTFALLLFLLYLINFILSLVTGQSFVERKSLLEKRYCSLIVIISRLSLKEKNFFGKDTDKFLAEILLGVSNVCNTYSKIR